jgi:hypothetical protein
VNQQILGKRGTDTRSPLVRSSSLLGDDDPFGGVSSGGLQRTSSLPSTIAPFSLSNTDPDPPSKRLRSLTASAGDQDDDPLGSPPQSGFGGFGGSTDDLSSYFASGDQDDDPIGSPPQSGFGSVGGSTDDLFGPQGLGGLGGFGGSTGDLFTPQGLGGSAGYGGLADSGGFGGLDDLGGNLAPLPSLFDLDLGDLGGSSSLLGGGDGTAQPTTNAAVAPFSLPQTVQTPQPQAVQPQTSQPQGTPPPQPQPTPQTVQAPPPQAVQPPPPRAPIDIGDADEYNLVDIANTHGISVAEASGHVREKFRKNPRTLRVHTPFGEKTVAKGRFPAFTDPSETTKAPQAMVSYQQKKYNHPGAKIAADYDKFTPELEREGKGQERAAELHRILTQVPPPPVTANLFDDRQRAAAAAILTVSQISEPLRTDAGSTKAADRAVSGLRKVGKGDLSLTQVFGDKKSSRYYPAREKGSGRERKYYSGKEPGTPGQPNLDDPDADAGTS